MTIRTVLAVVIAAVGVTAVAAQQNPIEARKAVMKAAVGGKMAKGEEPFSLEKAKTIFVTYQKVAEAHVLWPDDSKTGGDTASLPAIWENKADFDAKLVGSTRAR